MAPTSTKIKSLIPVETSALADNSPFIDKLKALVKSIWNPHSPEIINWKKTGKGIPIKGKINKGISFIFFKFFILFDTPKFPIFKEIIPASNTKWFSTTPLDISISYDIVIVSPKISNLHKTQL